MIDLRMPDGSLAGSIMVGGVEYVRADLARQVIAEEREACAKIAEQADCERQFVQPVIDAIRARGKP